MQLAEAKQVVQPQKLRSLKRGRMIERIVIYILLISLSIVFIFPFLWLMSTSLKPENEAMVFPPSLLPKVWDWENYKEVFEIVPFAKYYMNSLIVTIMGVLGTVLSSTIVAYGFARIKGKGQNFWFAILLATMMLPPQVTMIPVYIIFSKLGWVNTFMPLIVPAFFGNAYYIPIF